MKIVYIAEDKGALTDTQSVFVASILVLRGALVDQSSAFKTGEGVHIRRYVHESILTSEARPFRQDILGETRKDSTTYLQRNPSAKSMQSALAEQLWLFSSHSFRTRNGGRIWLYKPLEDSCES